jgi:CRP/FNR family transcriptional regulator, nitrogen fixation regulation protein
MTLLAFSIDPTVPNAPSIPSRVHRASSPNHGGSPPEVGLRSIGPIVHFAQDQSIYGEGEGAEVFFKVVSGVVRTCKFLSDGRRQIDSFYVAGDIFGLESTQAHSHCAEAVCECAVISYRRRGLEALAAEDKSLSRQLYSLAMRRLAQAQEHALSLGRRNAVEKVAAFLVDLSTNAPGVNIITLPMTRQDIADYLGLTMETVSRTLSQFERDAIIELPSARHVRMKDRAALRKLNS